MAAKYFDWAKAMAEKPPPCDWQGIYQLDAK